MVELKTSSLGGYRLIAKLGAGGMATVYLAVAVGKGRFRKLVVVKVLHDQFSNNTDFLEMFLGEARLAARLSHPNVVQTFEVGEDQGHHFIAMEYLEGQPYNVFLKKLGRRSVPLELHLRILSDLLSGLHYAHELEDFDGKPLGVVHRDVSPQNVFICYDGQVKLLDFGVAKAACADGQTKAGVIKGKVAYLAPEQITSQPVDRRADIFAVGVLLWEAIAGKRFSSGTIDAATMHNRISGAEPRIRQVAPDVPAELALISDKAIALDPEQRFQTALEMREALEAFLESRRDRCRQNSLATIVADTFSEERSTMKTIVEEHVLHVPSEPPDATLQPIVSVPDLSVAGPSRSEMTSAPSLAGSASSAKVASYGALSQPPSASGGRLAWIIAGSALTLVAVLGVVLLTRTSQRLPEPSTLPASAPAASSPPAGQPAQAQSVQLIVIASPTNATISLDGAVLQGNPFKASFTRDDRAHTVRVAAPGYADTERVVSFNADVTLTITLEQADGATAAGATDTPGKGHPKKAEAAPDAGGAAGTPAATPGTPRAGDDLRSAPPTATRKIDEKDPYAP